MSDLSTKPSDLIRATARESDSTSIFKPSKIIEVIESRLPAEILIQIAAACIEPYNLGIERKSDDVWHKAGFDPNDYCIRGFLPVEDLRAILAIKSNIDFNGEVEKTIQKKFLGRLELATEIGPYLNHLIREYDIGWLLSGVRHLVADNNNYDLLPTLNYNIFSNMMILEFVEMHRPCHYRDDLFSNRLDTTMMDWANWKLRMIIVGNKLHEVPDALSKITVSSLIPCPNKASPSGPTLFDLQDDPNTPRDENAAAMFKFAVSNGRVTGIISKQLVDLRY